MSKYWERAMARWPDSGNFVLGVWLAISPWIVGFTGHQPATWNAMIVGALIAAAAGAIYAFQRWEEWISALTAAWLVISPWALGFSAINRATWNAVAVGLAVLVLAYLGGTSQHRPRRRPA